MENYADSSFLISLIKRDPNSAAAEHYMAQYAQTLPYNPLHRLEVRNAIRLGVKRGELDGEQCKRILLQVETDLREEFLAYVSINWTDALRRAEELSHRHTETMGTRAVDILHVAIALENKARRFLSFDLVQRQLAEAEGLDVRP